MAKVMLNVELESGLVDRVRRYSEQHGTGVAETIEQLIGTLPANGTSDVRSLHSPAAPLPNEAEDWTRELTLGVRKLLGAGAGDADEEDYRRYLLGKHGR
ncbi:hypothetical protein [Longimicrobium sp.]|uniref:hypothetical protein n=1 Tax=Longimicrobium sp. TaxID=2029185 RepID=UPI002E2EDDD3|nr:hypothetical protein [Longimicrobium sp.]HEX6042406.1 hypothetical protein [Longimicrobium sp.]